MMFAAAEDRDVLAAEYVLGTLDGDERVQAQALMILDPDFAATVRAWERRFGELHVMLAPVAPPAGNFDRIKARLGETEKIDEVRLPEVALPADTPPEAVAASVSGPEIAPDAAHAHARMRAWRRLALLLVLLVLAGGSFAGLREVRPDLLPPELRHKPEVVEKVVEVQVGVPKPAAYVAVLQKEPFAPAVLLTFDLARTTLVARLLAPRPEPGKSYQLWMIPEDFAAPRSLGVLGPDEYTVRTTIAAYDPVVLYRARYAVSLEPEGGSPTDVPTGPMLHTGRLVATTPVGFPEGSP